MLVRSGDQNHFGCRLSSLLKYEKPPKNGINDVLMNKHAPIHDVHLNTNSLLSLRKIQLKYKNIILKKSSKRIRNIINLLRVPLQRLS